jgi:hypothetical protein
VIHGDQAHILKFVSSTQQAESGNTCGLSYRSIGEIAIGNSANDCSHYRIRADAQYGPDILKPRGEFV